MKTVKETFRDAIETGDWTDIRRVFTAITGEDAPYPPMNEGSSLDDVLNQGLDEQAKGDPLQRPMPTQEVDYEDDGSAEDDLIADEDDGPSPSLPTKVFVPPEEPQDDDPVSEFYIQHGSAIEENEDGERRCRREPINIPQQRSNLFRDNGKAFADEKVTMHPDNPKLGVQKVRPRGKRDKENDTGQQVAVKCSLCGKDEVVAARLAVGFNKNPEHNTYKCNSCNSPSGRAKVMRKKREQELNGRRSRSG